MPRSEAFCPKVAKNIFWIYFSWKKSLFGDLSVRSGSAQQLFFFFLTSCHATRHCDNRRVVYCCTAQQDQDWLAAANAAQPWRHELRQNKWNNNCKGRQLGWRLEKVLSTTRCFLHENYSLIFISKLIEHISLCKPWLYAMRGTQCCLPLAHTRGSNRVSNTSRFFG